MPRRLFCFGRDVRAQQAEFSKAETLNTDERGAVRVGGNAARVAGASVATRVTKYQDANFLGPN